MRTAKKLQKEFGTITFGEIFKSHREGADLTQTETAKLLKLSRQNVCDIEKGRWLPSPAHVTKFASKLGFSPTVFLNVYFNDLLKRESLDRYKVEVRDSEAD